MSVGRISLGRGKYALVDQEVVSFLSQWKWFAGFRGYAYRNEYEGGRYVRRVYMHRVVAETPKGMVTDHINMDTLDNRRDNLRNVLVGQNAFNRNKPKGNKSGYKGVYWDSESGMWRAQIKAQRRKWTLGRFASAKDAARAYNEAAIRLHGEFARINDL